MSAKVNLPNGGWLTCGRVTEDAPAKGYNVRTVNKALRAAGVKDELVHGRGYFYFWGDEATMWYTSTVPVYRVTALSVDEWVKEYFRLKAENDGRRG